MHLSLKDTILSCSLLPGVFFLHYRMQKIIFSNTVLAAVLPSLPVLADVPSTSWRALPQLPPPLVVGILRGLL